MLQKIIYHYGQEFHSLRRLELKKIKKLLNAKKGETILDLGCGKGQFCKYLNSKRVKTYGIDPLKKEILLAKKIQPKKIKFQIASGEKLPFINRKFDKVVSVCVLEHTNDDKKVLKEVNRVLKKNGTFVLSVDTLNNKHISEKYKKYHFKEYHVNYLYNKEKIIKIMNDNKFKVISVKYMFNSYISTILFRIGSFFHFRAPYILLFPILYPILSIDDYIRTKKNNGIIMVIKAKKI